MPATGETMPETPPPPPPPPPPPRASLSPHTRRAYAGALRRLDAWLGGRELNDSHLAPTSPICSEAGRAASRGYRPERPRPTRRGRGLERPQTAQRCGLVDGAIVALLFHCALRRGEIATALGRTSTSSDGNDVVVPSAARKDRPDRESERTCGGCAAAVRSLPRRDHTEPADLATGSRRRPINRRFAAACAAAGSMVGGPSSLHPAQLRHVRDEEHRRIRC